MAPDRQGIGVVLNGALAIEGERFAFVGPQDQLPSRFTTSPTINCEGRWVTPGLIDCHTHLVYAGHRADEFELRLKGASYEEIARAGGGIISSVKALRGASEDELVRQSLPRLDHLIREGVTTIEIKSGYGLATEHEAKTLRAARRLGHERSIDVVTTFLGAHALPPEAKSDRAAYVRAVIENMLPVIVGERRADAVDGFCEHIAFSPGDMAAIFAEAHSYGLPVRLHADQLSDCGGAKLASDWGALSADHLEYTNEEGAMALAKAGTVAVMLPAAYYFIRENKQPPIALFRKHGVKLAVATDCNPGSAPLTSLLLATNMAATLFRMTVEECLLGITRHAAQALGRLDTVGSLEIGKRADFCLWNIESPAELVYRLAFNPLHQRYWHGRTGDEG